MTAIPHPMISPAERRVLIQAMMGKNRLEISEALGITPSTVRGHVNRLLKKYDSKTRGQLVQLALYGRPLKQPEANAALDFTLAGKDLYDIRYLASDSAAILATPRGGHQCQETRS